MSEPEVTPNKKRKQNFSASECFLITKLVEKDLEVLRGKHSNVITNARKQKRWEEITLKVNSLGYAVRHPLKSVKNGETFRNMRKNQIRGLSSLEARQAEVPRSSH